MDPKPKTGYETDTATFEKIHVIGREIPLAKDIYDDLSDEKNITARVAESSLRITGETITLSERELFDDLLAFSDACRGLDINPADDKYGHASVVAGIDEFLDKMVFLSKDMYDEATNGLAEYHSAWIAENPYRRLLFVIPNQRRNKSQAAVTNDVASRVVVDDPERVRTVHTDDLTPEMFTRGTKIVLSDDWAIMGNHISNDVGKLLTKLNSLDDMHPEDIRIEIELLLARRNQVEEGIPVVEQAFKFMREIPEFVHEYANINPTIVAYFESPVSMNGFEMVTPAPTGSHSSADYNFAGRLDSLYQVAREHRVADHVPYIATIVPEYSVT